MDNSKDTILRLIGTICVIGLIVLGNPTVDKIIEVVGASIVVGAIWALKKGE